MSTSKTTVTDSQPRIPIRMEVEIELIGWLMVLLFQGMFVLRGLPCMEPGPHYVNTLLLKIQFKFVVLCIILTASICSYQLLITVNQNRSNQYDFLFLFIPLGGFIVLKLIVHYLIYVRVKYKDDGRELVNMYDFITIQVTFPSINCWVTY